MKEDTTKAVLLCAIHRGTRPSTASEVCDAAIALMQAESWPRRAWVELTPKSVSRHLQAMKDAGAIAGGEQRKEGGRQVPTYGPKDGMHHLKPEMPPPPDPEGSDHPLHGKTKRQTYVLFDVQDATLQLLNRHRVELREMVDRHMQDLEALVARTKREMVAAGLEVS